MKNDILLNLKKRLKEYKMFRYMVLPILFCERCICNIGILLREIGISNRYKNIKQFCNIHKGKRCFIIATGPSLTISDLEKLDNEYTFGMNSIAMICDKTNWKPTYYGIQDEYVYRNIESSIKNCGFKNIFVGSNLIKFFDIPQSFYVFPFNILKHKFPNAKLFTKFSKDCSLTVYDGYSITYSLIQLAVYMGFTEIYLLGADCSYNGKKQHFIEHGVIDKTADKAGDRMRFAYREAKKYADNNGIKIYNATRGGELEVFERVNLDDVL